LIAKIYTRDKRFALAAGAGSDAIHRNPIYSYAITDLVDDSGITGTGFAFTLGEGNDLVCKAAAFYATQLKGQDIEDLMADFGSVSKLLSNQQQLRWLCPHKGLVQLALASVTNACFDLWAKKRNVPLWKLLVDLSPQEIINTLDLSYLEDVLTREDALHLMQHAVQEKETRSGILQTGYPGYDTSIGWFNYDDKTVRENCHKAIAAGFTAMKLKVGAADPQKDIRRAHIVREEAGDHCKVMLDANKKWNLQKE